jgi:hypothetical protein
MTSSALANPCPFRTLFRSENRKNRTVTSPGNMSVSDAPTSSHCAWKDTSWPPTTVCRCDMVEKNETVLCQFLGRFFPFLGLMPLWSGGQSSWLQNGDVLCFPWGTNWIYICCKEESRPPLSSSGQSTWLQIQRSGFDSWRYQIFWEVVDPEQGPLSLVSTGSGKKTSPIWRGRCVSCGGGTAAEGVSIDSGWSAICSSRNGVARGALCVCCRGVYS